ERQVVLLLEFAMALGPLWTHTRHIETRALNRGVQVADGAGFTGTARREIGRVEIKDQRPGTQQGAQRYGLPSVIRQRKLWRSTPNLQHATTPRLHVSRPRS